MSAEAVHEHASLVAAHQLVEVTLVEVPGLEKRKGHITFDEQLRRVAMSTALVLKETRKH